MANSTDPSKSRRTADQRGGGSGAGRAGGGGGADPATARSVDRSAATLAGRGAVVTGSSSGIGRAIALELGRRGADVLVHGRRNRSGAEVTSESIQQLGQRAQVVLADVADATDRQRLIDAANAFHPSWSIWINCAGADVLTGPEREWSFADKLRLLWRTDVEGTIELSRMAAEALKPRGGVLLNIGWDQAQWGMAGESGQLFGTIKGAVMAFTLALAQSVGPTIRVNCIAPGWIRTGWAGQASDYWQHRAESESLAGRWGTPEEVAHVAAFLASDEAAFVNGQVIAVNGGYKFPSS